MMPTSTDVSFFFVTENFQDERAWQKGRVHEDAFSERDVVKHELCLCEDENFANVSETEALSSITIPALVIPKAG